MQKLRALLPVSSSGSGSGGGSSGGNGTLTSTSPAEAVADAEKRLSALLEPEIGFQITIEPQILQHQQQHQQQQQQQQQQCDIVPELVVHLISARHLPSLFGYKIVQGYIVKVKLFPGSKRLESTIQTNTWPKFNETFKFPLAPEFRSSLRHSTRQTLRNATEPEELLSGQFVVFTVYALLELPPTSLSRFNKTYRSLRDKSTSLVQKVIETSNTGEKSKEKPNDANTNGNSSSSSGGGGPGQQSKPKIQRDHRPMPALTVSEARRNIGSVTCYLEPKLFKRNPRTGLYSTNEIWLPIKDITTTVATRTQSYNGGYGNCNNNNDSNNNNNQLLNAAKGVVELALEVRACSGDQRALPVTPPPTPATPTTPTLPPLPSLPPLPLNSHECNDNGNGNGQADAWASPLNALNGSKIKWRDRMAAEVKRKMGMRNVSRSCSINGDQLPLLLRVTTSRMRCSPKVKDELECTAGSGVYVKTTIFEYGIYSNAWKSSSFYPSLSTKWDIDEATATLEIPLRCIEQLDNICIRTTLATKTKLGKKLVLGTVIIGVNAAPPTGTGAEHMRALRAAPLNERVAMWHCYR